MTAVNKLTVPGLLSLPVGWVTESVVPYTLLEVPRDAGELRIALEEELSAELLRNLGENGAVVSAVFTAEEGPELLTVTLHAECSERIDLEQPRDKDPQEG